MTHSSYRPFHRLAIVGLGAFLPLVLGAWSHPLSRTPDAQALLTQAIHNTDTVHTLVHTDTITLTATRGTAVVNARGQEDEVQNRERDYESVNVQLPGQNGSTRKLHYTVDIIFMNGQTYYRTSVQQNKWKSHSGMSFPDPYVGGWKRARTTVLVPSGAKFAQIGGASSGQIRMHTSFKTSTIRGTEDLWISSGKTPYVVRQDVVQTQGTGANQIKLHTVTSLGPFNRPMNIQPPTVGA